MYMYVYRLDENSFSIGARGDGIIATPNTIGLMHEYHARGYVLVIYLYWERRLLLIN